MKSILRLFAITLFASFFTLSVTAVQADGPTCTNQYGASIECPANNIVINKKVRYPTNANLFVENLTGNDAAYTPSGEIEYDVAVTNTSNVNYATVTVIDVFPSQVTFVSGPGRYEAASNKLTYEISDLKAGTTVHNRIVVKAKDVSVISQDTCDVINTVTVTGPGGQSDEDTAALCIKTSVTAPTLPVAGFEDYAYMIPFMALAIIGFGILAKGYIRP